MFYVSIGTAQITITQAGIDLCAVTGDANANVDASVSDVQRVLTEALGLAPAINDLSQDGAVNVIDVQIVMNALLGKGCSVPG